LPGSSHDLRAARTHGIIEALSSANMMTFADKAYQGARGSGPSSSYTTPRTPATQDEKGSMKLLTAQVSLATPRNISAFA
jgi:hypothetical protein